MKISLANDEKITLEIVINILKVYPRELGDF